MAQPLHETDSKRRRDCLHLQVAGDLLHECRRVTDLATGGTAHAVVLRAVRAGLPQVERELRDAARRVVAEAEGTR